MLRFSVYDDDGPASAWPLRGAHLLGPEDVGVRGRIRFENGVLTCERRGRDAVALCLLHETPPLGQLMLQTCLLPDREKPYVLTVELARHRIKQFIAKSEEWQMFDLSPGHPAMRHWEEARAHFTVAVTTPDPIAADRAAREALNQAITASERLAMAHAEILLHRRFASRAASSATLGVHVWPHRDGSALRELVKSNVDLVVMPLRWRDLEVEEGRFDWAPVDRWVQWAKEQGKPVVMGPLVDLSKRALPDWMYVWQHDYDTCRDLAYDYMSRVVERYRGVVGMWNVASALNTNENFELTSTQMVDLTRTASLLVRQSRRGARTMIEVRQPFGEHVAGKRDSLPPLSFIDRVVQEGVKFDALGVQLEIGTSGDGRASRDLMQLSSILDRFALLQVPVLVSALGAPS
ncbi:MAG: hypothetical protein HKN62_15695, partial [Phycisphaerales bacterium]|nr:hypothetical protein [Phycisphaerales bacterium]